MTRSEYNDFKQSKIYARIIEALDAGQTAAIEWWLTSGEEGCRTRVSAYRELKTILESGDDLVEEEDENA